MTHNHLRGFLALAICLCFVFLVSQPRNIRDAAFRAQAHIPFQNRDSLMDVTNRTLGFEKILVLSMPDRVDKKDIWSLASLYTDIDIEYVDGVNGLDIPQKAIPAGWNAKMDAETLGCFRGHMNVIQKIVQERISSALILEDDADYDVMLKSQLIEFARGARYLQGVTDSDDLISPYGDEWDILWVGHCGVTTRIDEDGEYYVISEDPTVAPEHRRRDKHWDRKPDMSPPELKGNFTRIILKPGRGLCAFGYAISLKGAEKFLLNFSVKPVAPVFDRALSKYCLAHLTGARCYAPYPSLFEQYRPAGNTSKDSDRQHLSGSGFRKHGKTANIVFPLKVNLETYVKGDQVIQSQWPKDTILQEINPQELQLPEGKPVFLTKEEFPPHPKEYTWLGFNE